MNLSGSLNLEKIIQYNLPESQFVREEHAKRQIVLHHSAGWDNARGMFDGWAADKQRVGTAMGIVDNGDVYQCFPSKYWAGHINFISKGNAVRNNPPFKKFNTAAHNTILDRQSVGVEICNWGALTLELDGTFKSWAKTKVDEKKVIHYDTAFRGSKYYERYTDAEIESLWKLIRFWAQKYDIPKTYNADMWDVSINAVGGVPGVWAHVSYRTDKSDIHPQPEIIQMLKAL